MDKDFKTIMVAILAVVSAGDAFTTVLGLYSIIKPVPGNELSWIICIGCGSFRTAKPGATEAVT